MTLTATAGLCWGPSKHDDGDDLDKLDYKWKPKFHWIRMTLTATAGLCWGHSEHDDLDDFDPTDKKTGLQLKAKIPLNQNDFKAATAGLCWGPSEHDDGDDLDITNKKTGQKLKPKSIESEWL